MLNKNSNLLGATTTPVLAAYQMLALANLVITGPHLYLNAVLFVYFIFLPRLFL